MIKVRKNVSLKEKTSFKIGGIARFYIEVSTKEELIEAYELAKKNCLPIFVIGEGTDILMSDSRYEGLIIRFVNDDFLIGEGEKAHRLVWAGSGLNWDSFVKKTVENGLQGVECLSGIPGTVGASPVQNIGAYGQEVKDSLYQVDVFDTNTEKFVTLNRKDCRLEYRDSLFKKEKGRYFIFRVSFKLNKDSKPKVVYTSLTNYLLEKGLTNPSLLQVRRAVLSIRNKKLENPARVGNAGSFFKNPVLSKDKINQIKSKFEDLPFFKVGHSFKVPAGWLIEKAGWKGKNFGGAAVSKTNALVIINSTGEAKAWEVRRLSERIKSDVKKKFGITLEAEVQFVNF